MSTETPPAAVAAMKQAWSDRHNETLTDDEAAYLTREHIDPGFMDFGSLTVLHAYRGGRSRADELDPPVSPNR